MLEYFFWTTPNGYKPLLMLEELGLPYQITPVNISEGDQFKPEFLKISPNNRIPALVDHAPASSKTPIALFESGAILVYLAEKSQRFMPEDHLTKADVLQWLFWQVGGLGPMSGQSLHFTHYAPEKIEYAKNRYFGETSRLFKVLDTQLSQRRFIANEYSIADMASYPWIHKFEQLEIDLSNFLHLKRWYDEIGERPATVRAYEKGAEINSVPTINPNSIRYLLGQSADTHSVN